MRHRTLLTSLLFCSLLLSGWSRVCAADAFCLRDAGQTAQTAEPDACCRARLEQRQEHCGASDEAMAMDEMEPSSPAIEHGDANALPARGRAAETCTHCASQSGPASTFVATREPEQKRRDMGVAAQAASSPLVLYASIFAPALQARQHAPPGAARSRHLLLNIFVI